MQEFKCVLWGYRTKHNVIVELEEGTPKRICKFDPVRNHVLLYKVDVNWCKTVLVNEGTLATVVGIPFAYVAIEPVFNSNTFIYKVIDSEATPPVEDDLWI